MSAALLAAAAVIAFTLGMLASRAVSPVLIAFRLGRAIGRLR